MLMELALGRRRSKILAVEWDVMMGICRSVRHGYSRLTRPRLKPRSKMRAGRVTSDGVSDELGGS